MRWNLIKAKGFGRADDRFAVERKDRQAGRNAAGGDQDMASIDDGFYVLGIRDFHRCRGCHFAGPHKNGHFVLLHQAADTGGQGCNHSVLAGQHGFEVKSDLADTDPVKGQLFFGVMIMLAGIEHGFGRNAADVQTGAAQGATLVDHSHRFT